MMDVKMLKLAAKAAGYDFRVGAYDEYIPGLHIIKDGFPIEWNPLEDDGDAFRLACALGIDIFPWCDKTNDQHDICGAARRRIVEAAAEIGRAMS